MNQILITGADGYIGQRLVQKYLNETSDSLVLWVRSNDEAEFEAKRKALSISLHRHLPRIQIVSARLTDVDPFLNINPETITKIIHTAAIIRFNVDEKDANEINFEGSRKLFKFARLCPHLQSIAYISTVYTSGMTEGDVEEAPLDNKAGFANHYERSKWEAETSLISEFSDLPWQVLRVATVICDDNDGQVTQYNAVHNTLKLFYYGLLSLIPGDKSTPLYFVTGEFVANAVFEIVQNEKTKLFFNIAHELKDCLTLEEFINLSYELFANDEGFKFRRVLKPLFVNHESFERLSGVVQGMGGEIMSQAIGTITPFAKQLFIRKNMRNENTMHALKGKCEAPNPRELLRNLVSDLLKTKWGRNSGPLKKEA